MSNIDANNRTVGFGVDENGDKVLLKVDSVTGYLLASASGAGTPSSTSGPKIDNNNRTVSFGRQSDGTLSSLITDSNGAIYAKE